MQLVQDVRLHQTEYRDLGIGLPPLFQVTHGPMEAHALGRGMTLAQSLGIEISGELHCQNYCKERQIIGAVRHTKTSKSIAVRKIDGERHSLRCNHCVEDLCLEPGVWRVGFYDG